MMGDVIQFFAFFILIMFAFGVGISELFWYYGSVQKASLLCSNSSNNTARNPSNNTGSDCQIVPFSDLWNSLQNLFWGIFGYLDPNELQLITEKHSNIGAFGLVLLGAYYIAVILILINMLIAMMAKSYEVTSANEEEEWRFYRAVIWVRYIRADFTSPPPMNLIPNFHFFYKVIRKFRDSKRNLTLNATENDGENELKNGTPLECLTRTDDEATIESSGDPGKFSVKKNIQSKSFNSNQHNIPNNDEKTLTSKSNNQSKLAVTNEHVVEPDILIKHTGALVYRYKLHKLLDNNSTTARVKLSTSDFYE